MKKLVHQVTTSQFGANVSAKPSGDYPCVQGRDFNADGRYIATEMQFVDASALRYTRFLKPGDILFSTKGKLFATVWQNPTENVVATGTFLILTVTATNLLPEYLAIYLNSAKAKKYFDLHTKAATVLHLGKKQFELLEIEIPPMEKQRAITKAHQLLVEEKMLMIQILNKKEKLLNSLI